MKQNCHFNQWFKNNPFTPSRRVFEEEKSELESEDPEDMADTVRNHKLDVGKEPTPITLPSSGIKEMTASKEGATTDVRTATSETLEETEKPEKTIARLKRENEQLRALVKVDVLLTDTLNRRSIEEELVANVAAIDGAREKGLREDEVEDLSVLHLDIDYFTQINTALGHPGGDAALKEFVKIIKTNLRSDDLLGRHGGEEFMVILPEADEKGAKNVAEKLRVAVKEGLKKRLAELYPDKKTAISTLAGTVSIGVTNYNTGSPKQSKTELIEQADQATYKAKHLGRDQVQVHSQITEEEGTSKKDLNKALLEATLESKTVDEFAAEMKKMAEKAMPKEPELQEKALRQAANLIRDDHNLALKAQRDRSPDSS